MAGELTAKEKVVGLKQTRRAVTQGTARQVYLACDADPALTEPLLALCREIGNLQGRYDTLTRLLAALTAAQPDYFLHGGDLKPLTMQQLGRACGIAVAAAAVAIVAQ